MIISTLLLRQDHPAVRRDARDVHQMHVRMESATDGHPSEPRLLWAQPAPHTLVVRSTMPVNRACFPAGYVAEAQHRECAEPPEEGERIRWAVIANPVRHTGLGVDRVAGAKKRTVVRDDPDAWAQDRLGACVDGPVTGTQIATAHGRQTHSGRKLTFFRWLFEGEGTVTDAERFAGYLRDGFGPAKGYGCGLLLWSAA